MNPLALLEHTNYEKIKQVIDRLQHTAREIFIFPSGGVGENLLATMKRLGVTVTGLGDNSPHKIGQAVRGLPVLSFQEISQKHKDAMILIGSRVYSQEIIRQFLGAGFSQEDLIFEEFNGYISLSQMDAAALLQKHSDKLKALEALLADEMSKQVLYGYLNYLFTFDPYYIAQIRSTETMYFDRTLFSLGPQENVIDGGGYTGDTFAVFSSLVPSFSEYYLCEPMHDIMERARRRLTSRPMTGEVHFVEKALWDHTETLFFDAQGSGSMVAEQETGIPIAAAPIDQITQGREISLIKLDVEGSEAHALQGARQTIARFRPKLAVCVYHLNNLFENGGFDILDLPLLIHEIEPSYRLYLRHYGRGLTDAVCYAL